jgi:hypothetical protein
MFRAVTNLGLILCVILTQFGCCCGLAFAVATPTSEHTSCDTPNKDLKRSCCDEREPSSSHHQEKLPGSCPCKDKKQFGSAASEKLDDSKLLILSAILLEPEPRLPSLTTVPHRLAPFESPPCLRYGRHLLDLLQTFRC